MKNFLKYLSVSVLSLLVMGTGFAVWKSGQPSEVVYKSIKATLNGTTTGTTYFEVTGGSVMDGSGNDFITGGALTGFITGGSLSNYMPISGNVPQIANINISGFYFGGGHDGVGNDPGVEQGYFFYDPSYPWIGMSANQIPVQLSYKSYNDNFSLLSVGDSISFSESSDSKNASFGPNGFRYGEDYSGSYINRSLVDKGYVDSAIALSTGITSNLSNNYMPYYTGGKLYNSNISLSGSESIVSGKLTITGGNAITFTEGKELKVNMGEEKGMIVQSAFESANVGIGHWVLRSMYNNAQLNTAIGARAMWRLTSGLRNTAVGGLALGGVTVGTDNTAVGIYASQSTTNGSYNVSVGDESLYYNTGGSQNTALGMGAGEYSYGSKNIFLGHFADVRTTTVGGTTTGLNLTNAIAIGDSAKVWTSNMMQLGNTGNGFISTNWNLGIGVSNPTNALSVSGNINVTTGYNIYDGAGNPYITGVDLASYVPYSGATQDVYIGNHNIVLGIGQNSLYAEEGTYGDYAGIQFPDESQMYVFGSVAGTIFDVSRLTSDKIVYLPDASGTVMLDTTQPWQPTSGGITYSGNIYDGSGNQYITGGSLLWNIYGPSNNILAPNIVGGYSFHAGFSSYASGTSSVAIGTYANAKGSYCTAVGINSYCSGNQSTAIGNQTYALGEFSLAMNTSNAQGRYATSIGFTSQASADFSTAIGNSVIAASPYGVNLGSFNVGLSTSIFEIGNGTNSSTGRNNALTILSGGNVGIGTSNPQYTLDISGSVQSNTAFQLTNGTDMFRQVFSGNNVVAQFKSGSNWITVTEYIRPR